MSNVSISSPTMSIKVAGTTLTEDQWALVTSAEVDQRLSAVDRCLLRFDDYMDQTAPQFSLGDAVEVAIIDGGGTSVTAFTGEITAISTEMAAGMGTMVYEASDLRHRLIRSLVPATVLNSTLGDIVTTIANNAGLTPQVDGTLSEITFESLAHAGTAFEVLREIERMTGTYSFVDTSGGLHVVPFDAPGSATLQIDDQLIEFEMTWSPLERADTVSVVGWDQATGQTISGQTTVTTVLPSIGLVTGTGLIGDAFRSSRVHAISADHAQKLAESEARRFRAQEVRGSGRIEPRGDARPGVTIAIDGVNTRFNGDYTLSAVTHRLQAGRLETRFRVGPTDEGIAEVLQQRDRAAGITVGRVTDNADPDSRGRVKVSLPLLGDEVETGWIRVATIGAAANRGIAFVPEVEDEVLVGFVHGDINHPYVLATVWNDSGDTFSGVVADGEVGERSITGRLGNTLRIIDKADGDDESGISIEVDGAATKIFLGYNKTEFITADRPMELKNGQASILLDGDKITIDATEITLKSDSGKVIIDANGIEATAATNIDMTASVNATLKANTMMTVEGSSMTAVKGGTVKVN